MVTMIGTDDVPAHGQSRDGPDLLEHRSRGRWAPLPVGDQYAVTTDDEQADGREAWLPDFLVAIDVVGEPDDAREFRQRDAALDGIGGSGLRRTLASADGQEQADDEGAIHAWEWGIGNRESMAG